MFLILRYNNYIIMNVIDGINPIDVINMVYIISRYDVIALIIY